MIPRPPKAPRYTIAPPVPIESAELAAAEEYARPEPTNLALWIATADPAPHDPRPLRPSREPVPVAYDAGRVARAGGGTS